MEGKRLAQYKIIEQDLLECILVGAYKQEGMIPTGSENGQVMDYTRRLMNSPKFQLRYIKQ